MHRCFECLAGRGTGHLDCLSQVRVVQLQEGGDRWTIKQGCAIGMVSLAVDVVGDQQTVLHYAETLTGHCPLPPDVVT